MKFILAVFTLLCVLGLSASQFSSYGQTIPVTNVSSSYNYSSAFGLGPASAGPVLIVSSTQAQSSSFVTLRQLTNAPSASVNYRGSPVSYALPAGYSLISGPPQVGFTFELSSDLNNSPAFSGLLQVPSYPGYSNLSSQGRQFGLLYYDSANQSYSAVPTSDYNTTNTGAIAIRILRSTQLVIASRVIGAIPFNLTTSSPSSSVYVLGNTSQSFSILENGNAALLINNLTSQTGGFSVALSNTAAQLSAISSQNLTLVSSIYNFDHSSGVNGVQSAILSYNLLLSSNSNFTASLAQWYSFNPTTNVPVLLSGSSLSNSVVSQNIASLSGSYAVLSTLSNIQLNSYNATLPVSNSASVFNFGKSAGLGPVLTVSSSAATSTSSVIVSQITTLPNIQIPSGSGVSTFNLPSGFSSLSSLTGQQGFNITFSPDLNNSPVLTSALTTAAIPNYATLLSAGSVVVPLTYDSNAGSFVAIPSSDYQLYNNGSIRIVLTRSLSFILASYNPRASIASISNSVTATFLLAGNYPQTLSIGNAAGVLSLVLNNLTAAAGSLSVQFSNNAAAQTSAARNAGRAILSNIYNITHSAGSSAFVFARIQAYVNSLQLNSSSISYDVSTAQWYRFTPAFSGFDSLAGSLGSDSNGQFLSAPISSIQYSDFSVQASGILTAAYSQAINVTANAVAYRFSPVNGALDRVPVLVVSAPNASPTSTVSVDLILSLPRIPVNVGNGTANFNLPSGYNPASLSLTLSTVIQQGFSFNFSSDLITSGVNAVLQIPAAALGAVRDNLSNLVLLSYNASSQTFSAIPASQYSVQADGSVNVNVVPRSLNTNLIFATRNFSANVIDVANGGYAYFLLAANSSQSFVVQQGNRAAVTISNLTADAGTLYVATSNNFNAQSNAASAAGNTLVSGIYTFTHSAGSQAVKSARLEYNLASSTVAGTDVNTVSWYRFNSVSNVWEARSSSVSGSGSSQVVVTTTDSFSDWSVQSRNANPGSTTSSGANLQANAVFKVISELF